MAIEDFLSLPSKFISVFPFQAMCGLSGIVAVADAGQVADELWDLTGLDPCFYTFIASIVSQEETAQRPLESIR
jgi:hypothetical protein